MKLWRLSQRKLFTNKFTQAYNLRYTNVEAPEYTVDEMQTLNICITEKVTR